MLNSTSNECYDKIFTGKSELKKQTLQKSSFCIYL